MGIIEVLASWGMPNDRRSSETGDTEHWAYYAKDEHTQKLVSYELVFDKRVLTRWVVRADLPSGVGTAPAKADPSRVIEETLRLGETTQSTETPVKK